MAAGADPNDGALATFAAGSDGVLNENAGGLVSAGATNAGLALKLNAGEVLPKAAGAVSDEPTLAFSAGFAPKNPVLVAAGCAVLF